MTDTEILALISSPKHQKHQQGPVLQNSNKRMTKKHNLSEKVLPSEGNDGELSPEIRFLSPNEKMVLDEDLICVPGAGWGDSSRSTPDSLEDLLADSDDDSPPSKNKEPVEDDLDTLE